MRGLAKAPECLPQAEKPAAKRSGVTANDLASLCDIVTFVLSPDGARAAYLVRQADPAADSYTQSWYLARLDGGAEPVVLTGGGDVQLRVLPDGRRIGEFENPQSAWSKDGHWFVFLRSDEGRSQLWRANPDTGVEERLTDHPSADVETFLWSGDGESLIYTLGPDRKVQAEIEEAAAKSGWLVEPEAMLHYQGGIRKIASRCAGFSRANLDSLFASCAGEKWVLDWRSRSSRRLREGESEEGDDARQTPYPSLKARVYSADGVRYIGFENADPETFKGIAPPLRLFVANAENGKKTLCNQPQCAGFTLKQAWWRETASRSEVVFYALDGSGYGTASLYAWSPSDGALRTVWRSDEARLSGCVMARARLTCLHESWTRPPYLAAVSLETGDATTIADPNDGWRRFKFTRIEKLVYKDNAGNETHGHLVYPADYAPGERYPLVITQYRSGGFLRGAVGDEQPIYVYAQNGMFVLSTNLPDDFDMRARVNDLWALQNRAWSDTYVKAREVTALENAVDILDERGLIDPKRVGITGLSYGAMITSVALTKSDYFAAASAATSFLSPTTYYLANSEAERKSQRTILGGAPFSDAITNWRKHSLGLNAEKVNTPYLLQSADSEYLFSVQNYLDLRAAGKPVEMIVYPDEYHVKWRPAHRLAVYRRNIDWFNFWLRGVEDDVPEKAVQYEHWRKMRAEFRAQKTKLKPRFGSISGLLPCSSDK
ncbi:Atxe2 family lasso peptide isopeptidase [Hyphococcus luteus]|nr:Atxe2 family lasso peptide isopeptidase [Marinicaulis flavus]